MQCIICIIYTYAYNVIHIIYITDNLICNIGNTYKSLEQYDNAIDAYKQAIYINKHYTPAYNNLSIIYYEKHEYKQAICILKEVLLIDSGFIDAMNNLGNICIYIIIITIYTHSIHICIYV